jgi:hypothetical protein
MIIGFNLRTVDLFFKNYVRNTNLNLVGENYLPAKYLSKLTKFFHQEMVNAFFTAQCLLYLTHFQ